MAAVSTAQNCAGFSGVRHTCKALNITYGLLGSFKQQTSEQGTKAVVTLGPGTGGLRGTLAAAAPASSPLTAADAEGALQESACCRGGSGGEGPA